MVHQQNKVCLPIVEEGKRRECENERSREGENERVINWENERVNSVNHNGIGISQSVSHSLLFDKLVGVRH
jgi:hypothetical protein